MSQEPNIRLDKLLEGLESIRFQRKNSRRVRVASKVLSALLELLQGRASYVHLSAITCVDWMEEGEFELVYHVCSYETCSLVSAHTRIPRLVAASCSAEVLLPIVYDRYWHQPGNP